MLSLELRRTGTTKPGITHAPVDGARAASKSHGRTGDGLVVNRSRWFAVTAGCVQRWTGSLGKLPVHHELIPKVKENRGHPLYFGEQITQVVC